MTMIPVGGIMGLSKVSILVLTIAAVMCITGTVVDAAALAPPSTDGWTLTPVIDGNSIQLLLGIDNSAWLAGYAGELSKSWGDPTLTDRSKFIALGDSGAFLQSLTISLDGDPKVKVQFSVLAGLTNTAFTITPATSTPPSVGPVTLAATNPTATATASITVTDCDGNGAWAAPDAQYGTFYRAIYNTNQTFASLIDGAIGGPVGTINVLPDDGKTGEGFKAWTTIPGSVTSMTAQFSFTLSANDTASGTSSFTVVPVPEPGSMLAMFTGIVGMAGFALRRRRA
jgi:hypothetical protein